MQIFVKKAAKKNYENEITGYSPYLQSILGKVPATTVCDII